MSIHYTVRPCDNGDLPLVDRDGVEDDLSDYIDQMDLQPRGRGPQNRTVLIQVCKKALANNNTQSVNASGQNVTDDKPEGTAAEGQSSCQLREVAVTSLEGGASEGGIPLNILEEIERDGEWTVSQNGTESEGERGGRQRRQAEGNWTDVDISSRASEDLGIESGEQAAGNRTDTSAEVKAEDKSEMSDVNNGTKGELEESNEILLNSNPLLNKKVSTVEPTDSGEMDQNYIQSEPERLTVDLLDLDNNYTAENNNTTGLDLALDYDDYSQEVLFSVCVSYVHLLRGYNSICWMLQMETLPPHSQ